MRRSGSTEKEVEHAVFTPLVFSTSEGIGKECQMFYKRLADMLSHKRDLPLVTSWDGSDASSYSPSYGHVSCASGGAGPLDTTLSRTQRT